MNVIVCGLTPTPCTFLVLIKLADATGEWRSIYYSSSASIAQVRSTVRKMLHRRRVSYLLMEVHVARNYVGPSHQSIDLRRMEIK